MSDVQYGKRSKWPIAAGFSLVLIALLFMSMKAISQRSAVISKDELVIYCAAGIKLPIMEITKAYTEQFGTPVRLELGSSGELEAKLLKDAKYGKTRAHLYIPADGSFSKRTSEKGLSFESLPLARFDLVLGVKPDDDPSVNSVRELLDKHVPFVVCNEKAGAGKKTMDGLKKHGLWDEIVEKRKVVVAKVPECAGTVKTANDIKAGFMWNTTAKQFGLKIVNPPELEGVGASINVNVTKCDNPAAALHLARFLSAPKNSKYFEKHGFATRPGDKWESSPKLVLFCGGVNKKAVEKTIAEFEKREGIKIEAEYDGCGTLVASMSAQSTTGTFPDAFLTCDKTYFDKVSSEYLEPEDLSSTEIVILVRKGNPLGIKSIKDLTKDGLKVGTNNRRKSTLGFLSWKIFEEYGIEEKMNTNVVVTAPNAHKLITQFMAHDKLDAALVYYANCSQVLDEYELIPIDHPLATAIQNIGISKKSKFPLMMSRLIQELKSVKSKNRYEQTGFKWIKN